MVSDRGLCLLAARCSLLARRYSAQEGVHGFVDHIRVDHGTICRDTHNDIGLMKAGGLVIAVQHVMSAAAVAFVLPFSTQVRDGIIGCVRGGGDKDIAQGFCPTRPFDNAHQHGLAIDIEQHFIGQAGRGHAGLDYGDGKVVGQEIRREYFGLRIETFDVRSNK